MRCVRYWTEHAGGDVQSAFRFLASFVGCAFHRTSEQRTADIIYGGRPPTDDNGSASKTHLRIPYWGECYDPRAKHGLNKRGQWVPLSRLGAESPPDYLGSIFRHLMLLDEVLVPDAERDTFGNLRPHLDFPRGRLRDRPLADEAAQAIKTLIVQHGLVREAEFLPRWPQAKRYALVITHDTDGPCLLSPMELVKAGAKGVMRRNHAEAAAFVEGMRALATGGADPYFAFASWADFEESLGAKSAFYVYAKSQRVPSHLHNPPYRIGASPRWQVLRDLASRGWEIGLHASINALLNDDYVTIERQTLEAVLGDTVIGNRNHYWRINWRNPTESFRRLERAGFLYDSSMAWKDAPGFRAGTALPYHPYDPDSGSSLALLEMPTAVMDGHLFQYQAVSDPHELFATITDAVRLHGGILHLDWHERTWVNRFSYAGWRSFIVDELRQLAESNEAWFATPRELVSHWLDRERRLGVLTPCG